MKPQIEMDAKTSEHLRTIAGRLLIEPSQSRERTAGLNKKYSMVREGDCVTLTRTGKRVTQVTFLKNANGWSVQTVSGLYGNHGPQTIEKTQEQLARLKASTQSPHVQVAAEHTLNQRELAPVIL